MTVGKANNALAGIERVMERHLHFQAFPSLIDFLCVFYLHIPRERSGVVGWCDGAG